ncbi:mediator of RNA polymerase II transcription subunit 23-like [Centruroides sculpturatus]|uniref:mediator of RNA polymerase II transcription subunit 23-like n=1 Tax=Centruroides sculpturatus TaxID=218467 RepID=UPI000C6EBCE3|nr:mediator of RNA polymerase II transcription subunit 23-like [Centruroides sculpturatus]
MTQALSDSTNQEYFARPMGVLVEAVQGNQKTQTTISATNSVVNGPTHPLSMSILDSLTVHTKMSLIHNIVTHVMKLGQTKTSLSLAPALVETYSRLLVYNEIESLGIKGFISHLLPNIFRSQAWGILHTLLEMFSYRLHHIQPHYRVQLLSHLHSMAAVPQTNQTQLHLCVESTALKLIAGLGSAEVQPQLSRFQTEPKPLLSGESEELNKVLILTLARAIHITAMSNENDIISHFSLQGSSPLFLCLLWKMLLENDRISPLAYKILDRIGARALSSHLRTFADFLVFEFANSVGGQHVNKCIDALNDLIWKCHVITLDRLILCLALRSFEGNEAQVCFFIIQMLLVRPNEFKNRVYEFVRENSPEHWRQSNWHEKHLVFHRKYPEKFYFEGLQDLSAQSSQHTYLPVYFGNVCLRFLPVSYFHYICILSNVMRIVTLKNKKNNSPEHWRQSNWHEKHLVFHRKYPEKFYFEGLQDLSAQSSQHTYLPVYFGNVCLRFLPVMDIVIHRFLELPSVSMSVETLLDQLGCLYKFHGMFSFFHGILKEVRSKSATHPAPPTVASPITPVSYAEATKINVKPSSTTLVINRSLKNKINNEGSGGSFALLLYPKTDEEGLLTKMNQIESEIKKRIKLQELRTDSQKEAEILSDAINEHPDIVDKVRSKISEGRRPQVILTNVPISVDEADIIPTIFTQNEIFQSMTKDEFTYSTRISTVLFRNNARENCWHIVLSTTPRIRNILVRTKHIAIEWAKIYVNDYISLVRCFQCCGYNHLSTNCPNRQRCSHCGKVHRFSDCRRLENPPNCINCRTVNKELLEYDRYDTTNNAFNPQCPITIKMKAQTIRQTNYGFRQKQSELRLLQINLQRCKATATDSFHQATQRMIDLMSIQEPYTFNNNIAMFGNFRTIYLHDHNNSPKTGFLNWNPGDIVNITDRAGIDKVVNELHNVIQRAYSQSTTVKTVKCTAPWWNQDLTNQRNTLRKVKKRLRKEHDLNKKQEIRNEYTTLFKNYKTAINKARSQAWKDFCSKVGNKNLWSTPYYVVTGKKKKLQIPPSIRINNDEYASSITETYRHIIHELFPDDRLDQDDQYHKDIRANIEKDYHTINDTPFTMLEIDREFRRLKLKKAPGPDYITAKMAKNAFLAIPTTFCTLFNKCLDIHYFPTAWKRASIRSTSAICGNSPFPHTDWRFNEFPNPAAHALHVTCIELMALPLAANTVGNALLDVILKGHTVLSRSNIESWMNAVALVLTALPESYWSVLHDRILEVIQSPLLSMPLPDMDPFQVFDFSKSHCTMTEVQCSHLIALTHAIWYHASVGQISAVLPFMREKLKPVIKTEEQLLFLCHLVGPFLQRFQGERSRCIKEVTIELYEMLELVSKNYDQLKYMEAICDLLYHIKYMFTGDVVKNDVERSIRTLKPKLQMRLRFVTHLNIEEVTVT